MRVRKFHIEELTIEGFCTKFGIENSDDVLSWKFEDEFEKNGYSIYYADGRLESILDMWEEEFEGIYGNAENALDFYYVNDSFMGIWKD